MKIPKVSVVMPNYNCEKYLVEAIESILNQSFKDFEFIIIDDGSTDNSWNIIQEYAKKDNRIVAVKNEENLGVTKTRNKLIKKSNTNYMAMFDSDDLALKEWLENIYNKISSDVKLGIVGTNFDIIDSEGQKIGERIFPETNTECKKSIWFRNPFGQNTVILRKKAILDVGGYDESFGVAEDFDLWVRIGQKYDFSNIQKKLIEYRIHGENSILKQQKLMIQNTLKIRKKAIRLGYKINLKGRIFYIGTWFMQFLPPKFVLWLFNLINKDVK